jgi:hypothetical protein
LCNASFFFHSRLSKAAYLQVSGFFVYGDIELEVQTSFWFSGRCFEKILQLVSISDTQVPSPFCLSRGRRRMGLISFGLIIVGSDLSIPNKDA